MSTYSIELQYRNGDIKEVKLQCITTRDIFDRARQQAALEGVTGEVVGGIITLLDKRP